jgi:hypothetical protein
METAAIATWRRGRRILFIMGVILLQGATLPNHGEQGPELYSAAQILHPRAQASQVVAGPLRQIESWR